MSDVREKVEIGTATLYLGDCMEILPTLDKVDAVVTDPPFFHPVNHYVNARNKKPAKKTLGDMSALKHFFRIVIESIPLNDSASTYWFCDGQTYGISFEALYPSFKRVRPIIWDKVVSFNGYTWRHQHELIAWAEGNEAVRVPTGDGDIIKCRAVKVADRLHPAEKPVELISIILKKTDGKVLDPFMGSGTTGVACANLGRKFIGIEIERKYFDIACERIEAAQNLGRMEALPSCLA